MLENFIRFLNRSPTVYHAAKEISTRLMEAHFTPLSEKQRWKLEPGKGYFLTREDTLLAAFRLPQKTPASATILASHIDSPALKLKPHPEISSHGIHLLGTEIYGAPLLHTWIDRDLAIGGRIIVSHKNGCSESKIVWLHEDPLTIPSVAIHLNREVNEKGLIVHKQDHLKAILSLHSKEKQWEDLLKKAHPCEQILSFDLFLVPIEPASFLGSKKEMIASYRLDNLTSAFASLEALLSANPSSDTIQMALFWDHEEIGSKTYAGADSLFTDQLLERIGAHWNLDREDHYRLKSRSLCLSCDVGHAFHPNFAEKYDPQNAPLMGKGPALKFSSKYATSGSTAAPLVTLAQKHQIPLQTFASRSDLPSGSTVGAMMGANLGIPTVDLGVACWGMHSIRETISSQDQLHLQELLLKALNEPLTLPEEA